MIKKCIEIRGIMESEGIDLDCTAYAVILNGLLERNRFEEAWVICNKAQEEEKIPMEFLSWMEKRIMERRREFGKQNYCQRNNEGRIPHQNQRNYENMDKFRILLSEGRLMNTYEGSSIETLLKCLGDLIDKDKLNNL